PALAGACTPEAERSLAYAPPISLATQRNVWAPTSIRLSARGVSGKLSSIWDESGRSVLPAGRAGTERYDDSLVKRGTTPGQLAHRMRLEPVGAGRSS